MNLEIDYSVRFYITGGSILSTRNTEDYTAGSPGLTLFGIPICIQQNTPRAVIQVAAIISFLIFIGTKSRFH